MSSASSVPRISPAPRNHTASRDLVHAATALPAKASPGTLAGGRTHSSAFAPTGPRSG